jgi:hypothetical protein
MVGAMVAVTFSAIGAIVVVATATMVSGAIVVAFCDGVIELHAHCGRVAV